MRRNRLRHGERPACFESLDAKPALHPQRRFLPPCSSTAHFLPATMVSRGGGGSHNHSVTLSVPSQNFTMHTHQIPVIETR